MQRPKLPVKGIYPHEKNPQDVNYKWFALKGNFEIGNFAPQKIRAFPTLLC